MEQVHYDKPMRRSIAIVLAIFLSVPMLLCSPAGAQTVTTTTGAIRGTVKGSRGGLGSATITVSGPIIRSAVSSPDGSFTIGDLPRGLYTVTVRASGFRPSSKSGLAVIDGETSIDVQLSALDDVKTIGRVTTQSSGIHFNTTSASVQEVTQQTIDERDLTNLRQALESIPGVTLSRSSEYEGNSSSVFDNVVFPVVRGGEPYETGTLIDGHPMYGAASNLGFSVGWIPTGFLQSVDAVKGPGATTPSINNAINGSVNFVTIDPRSKPETRLEAETDGFGGSILRFRTIDKFGKFSFALGYQQQVSPGPTNNKSVPYILGQNNTNSINGQPFASCVGTNCYATPGANSSQYFNGADAFSTTTNFNVQGIACCTTDHTAYSNRAELVKLRYDFSPSLYATIGYFGNQTFQQLGVQNLGQFNFTPAAGYTGGIPAGPIAAATGYDGASTAQLSGKGFNTAFTADLVGTLGNIVLSAKAIQVNTRQNYSNGVPFLGTDSVQPGSVPAMLYGTIASGTVPSYTTYNGTTVAFTPSLGAYTYTYGTNLGGLTLQADLPVADNVYTIAYDKTQYTPTFSYDYGYAYGDLAANPYPGNYEVIESILARAAVRVAPRIRATASVYYNRYDAHASVDNNVTFGDFRSNYVAPRLGITWRPETNTSVRFAAGSSIAPAVLTNIIGGQEPITPNNSANPSYYTYSITNAAVKPETAFGYDIGADHVLGRSGIVISGDIYTTNLVNQLFTESTPNGTYNGLPLYVVQYTNIAHARYEGVELSIGRDVQRGFFWSASGSLMRAAPYNLPPSFYSLPNLPNSTNLGIVNGANFTGVNTGFNGASNGVSVPYSTASATIGWRTSHAGFARLDLNYYGPNNQYYEPAFAVLNASLGVPVARNLLVTATLLNLTNAYSSPYPIYQNGYTGGFSPTLVTGQKFYGISDGPGPTYLKVGLSYKF
ncbi:MAG: TonB-dependent receptor [Candidatus Eremiobacteraeota bacterium]|nr:TonB-dependent receptor [Candidatus Eremiobacteraeota bacterium]